MKKKSIPIFRPITEDTIEKFKKGMWKKAVDVTREEEKITPEELISKSYALLRSAEKLVKKGWCKGQMYNVPHEGEIQYCAVGAVYAHDGSPYRAAGWGAETALDYALTLYVTPTFASVGHFNDSTHTTHADVLQLYFLTLRNMEEAWPLLTNQKPAKPAKPKKKGKEVK